MVNADIFGGELEDQIEFWFSFETEIINNPELDHGYFPTRQRINNKLVLGRNLVRLLTY